jgi:hypothetical protein
MNFLQTSYQILTKLLKSIHNRHQNFLQTYKEVCTNILRALHELLTD